MAVPIGATLLSLLEVVDAISKISKMLANGEITDAEAQNRSRAVMEANITASNEALQDAVNEALEEEN